MVEIFDNDDVIMFSLLFFSDVDVVIGIWIGDVSVFMSN